LRVPVSRGGWMPLATALQTLGHARFGQGWAVAPLDYLAESIGETKAELLTEFGEYQWDQIELRYPKTIRLAMKFAFQDYYDVHLEGMANALMYLRNVISDLLNRYQRVFRVLADVIYDRKISVSWRAVEGGAFTDFDPLLLNVDDAPTPLLAGRSHRDRLTRRTIEYLYNAGESWEPYEAGFLFVRADDFERWFETTHSTNPTLIATASYSDPQNYLSPYLRFMIEQTHALELSLTSTMTKEELIERLRIAGRRWTGTKPLGNRDFDRMATLMREPDAKDGRGRKLPKPDIL
jgi:hypothetical protein